jgi:methylmalonyl-CoA epimerase
MILTEIDHVAIAVNDLEAAIDYYKRAVGAEVDHREVVESDGVEEALLKVAESYVQLLTPTRPDSPVAKAIEKFKGAFGQSTTDSFACFVRGMKR